MRTNKAAGGVLMAFLIGAIIGTLYAPKKGSETRADVSREAKKAVDMTNKYFNKVERQANRTRKDVANKIEVLVAQVKDGDESAKVELQRFLDEIDEVATK